MFLTQATNILTSSSARYTRSFHSSPHCYDSSKSNNSKKSIGIKHLGKQLISTFREFSNKTVLSAKKYRIEFFSGISEHVTSMISNGINSVNIKKTFSAFLLLAVAIGALCGLANLVYNFFSHPLDGIQQIFDFISNIIVGLCSKFVSTLRSLKNFADSLAEYWVNDDEILSTSEQAKTTGSDSDHSKTARLSDPNVSHMTIEQHNKVVSLLQERIDEQQKRIEKRENELIECVNFWSESVVNFQTTLNTLQKDFNSFQREMNNLQKDDNNSKKDFNNLQKDFHNLQNEVRDMSNKVNAIDKKVEDNKSSAQPSVVNDQPVISRSKEKYSIEKEDNKTVLEHEVNRLPRWFTIIKKYVTSSFSFSSKFDNSFNNLKQYKSSFCLDNSMTEKYSTFSRKVCERFLSQYLQVFSEINGDNATSNTTSGESTTSNTTNDGLLYLIQH